MQGDEGKHLDVVASNTVIPLVEKNVGKHMQSCDVEEGEWIQVSRDIYNHGAGIIV